MSVIAGLYNDLWRAGDVAPSLTSAFCKALPGSLKGLSRFSAMSNYLLACGLAVSALGNFIRLVVGPPHTYDNVYPRGNRRRQLQDEEVVAMIKLALCLALLMPILLRESSRIVNAAARSLRG